MAMAVPIVMVVMLVFMIMPVLMIVMMMIVCVVPVIVRRGAVIGAALGRERRLDGAQRRAQPDEHVGDDMILADQDALRRDLAPGDAGCRDARRGAAADAGSPR